MMNNNQWTITNGYTLMDFQWMDDQWTNANGPSSVDENQWIDVINQCLHPWDAFSAVTVTLM